MRCARVAAPLARAPTRAPASTLHQLRLVAAVKAQMPLRSCYQKSRCAGSRRLVRGRHCCSKEHLRQPNPPPAPSSLRGRKLLARGASSIKWLESREGHNHRARWPRGLQSRRHRAAAHGRAPPRQTKDPPARCTARRPAPHTHSPPANDATYRAMRSATLRSCSGVTEAWLAACVVEPLSESHDPCHDHEPYLPLEVP